MSKLDKVLKITGGDRNYIVDIADVYQEEIKALKITLRPAIEAANQYRQNPCGSSGAALLQAAARRLPEAGEILGLTAEESEVG